MNHTGKERARIRRTRSGTIDFAHYEHRARELRARSVADGIVHAVRRIRSAAGRLGRIGASVRTAASQRRLL